MLDPDLLSFIRSSIRSTWALEMLVLVRRQAARAFAPDALVLELRASRALVANCLKQLEAAGLIACDENGLCRYAPASPALDVACAELERAYSERPLAVITAIVESPNERLKSFADAFKFSKKDD